MAARTAGRGRRTAMRMGVLDLFVVVVGICVAVLAVLALSTSMASLRLSERQLDNMQLVYDVDVEGQRFAADLDERLAHLSSGGAAAADVVVALEGELPALVGDVADAEDGVLVEAKVVGVADMAEMLGGSYSAVDASAYAGGVRATITSEEGYELTCLFAIDNQCTYEVLVWKSTKVWDESAQSEQLWLG